MLKFQHRSLVLYLVSLSPHPSNFICCASNHIVFPPQAVEKLVQGAESGCPTEKEKQVVLNCTRILSRVLPYIFEDQDWRGFFWSTVPGAGRAGVRWKTYLLIAKIWVTQVFF